MSQNPVIIFDFETTGLSPKQGDRVIEVGAVRIQNNIITERFSALMNPGFAITPFIEQYTGKPLELKDSPKVMRAFHINDSSKYILAYDGVQLGMIRYINDGCNFTVEFTRNELLRLCT